MKLSRINIFLVATLFVSILSVAPANATTATFSCGGGGSYTVSNGVFSMGFQDQCVGALTLDSSVTTIPYPTYMQQVTSLTIPATTVTIDDGAIGNSLITEFIVDAANPNYKSVNGVLYSKTGATLKIYPQNKAGTSFTVPGDVTTISYSAFQSPVNLQTVNITETVTVLNGAFSSCCGDYINSLREINVSADNPNYSSIDGVLLNKAQTELLFYPDDAQRTSYVVPATVTRLRGAFSGNHNLQTITLPNGLLSMETYEFEQAQRLQSIDIPASVNSLGSYPFLGITTLVAINVDPANANYKSIAGVLYSKDGTQLLEYPDGRSDVEFTIPAGVETATSQWVWGNNLLRTINVPSSLRKFEYGYLGAVTRVNFEGNSSILQIQGQFNGNPSALSIRYCGVANSVITAFFTGSTFVSCVQSQQQNIPSPPTPEEVARLAAIERDRLVKIAKQQLIEAIIKGETLTVLLFSKADLQGVQDTNLKSVSARIHSEGNLAPVTFEKVSSIISEFRIVANIASKQVKFYASDLIFIKLISADEKHKSAILRALIALPSEKVDTVEEIKSEIKVVQDKFAARDLVLKRLRGR